MSSSNQFENVDPALASALRAYLGKPQKALAPSCDHAPVSCAWTSETDHTCKIQSLAKSWKAADHTYTYRDHPLVLALEKVGCHQLRARMVISEQGYGMTIETSKSVIDGYRKLKECNSGALPKGVSACDQCQPGTNTFALQGASYKGNCWFTPVSIAKTTALAQNGKVLCIGPGGELKWCGDKEFIAVSHVWEHGWKGDSEKGVCKRVLDMLLLVARLFGLEWVWLDIAMISRNPEFRTMSINSMDLVYSKAKATIVCDRLLLSMNSGNDRERVMMIYLSDWMTRVWTMQEAILTQDLIFLFGDSYISGKELLHALINKAPRLRPDLHWQQYRAIRTLNGMLEATTTPILDRVQSLSKERLTSKRTDMVRAIYPLFKLKWPGPGTTLEDGQIKLLTHLGKEAGMLGSLNGPIMPRPWSWALLTIVGCAGGLQKREFAMQVTASGLKGEWSAWNVRIIGHDGQNSSIIRSDGFGANIATLTDTCFGMIHLEIDGVAHRFSGHTYYRREDPPPWKGQKLLLLWGYNTRSPRTDAIDQYHLVVVDEKLHSTGELVLHRVGSVSGGLAGSAHSQGLEVKKPSVIGYIS
jgi:hypothetical protein